MPMEQNFSCIRKGPEKFGSPPYPVIGRGGMRIRATSNYPEKPSKNSKEVNQNRNSCGVHEQIPNISGENAAAFSGRFSREEGNF